jgi:uncharacterized protein
MEKVEIKKLTKEDSLAMNVENWPIWEKEVSKFDWQYDGEEECLILEGEAIIETDDDLFYIKAGDFVTFKDGLKCKWDIKKPIRKYYNFT